MKTTNSNGFTLIEALIALAVFAVISVGALQVWLYTSQASLDLIAGTDGFENARGAMDVLLVNLQLAEEITLEIDGGGLLKKLTLCEVGPEKEHPYHDHNKANNSLDDDYVFDYLPKYNRLEFGENEFASQLGGIWLKKEGDLIKITISTDGEAAELVTLQSAADISNKKFQCPEP